MHHEELRKLHLDQQLRPKCRDQKENAILSNWLKIILCFLFIIYLDLGFKALRFGVLLFSFVCGVFWSCFVFILKQTNKQTTLGHEASPTVAGQAPGRQQRPRPPAPGAVPGMRTAPSSGRHVSTNFHRKTNGACENARNPGSAAAAAP